VRHENGDRFLIIIKQRASLDFSSHRWTKEKMKMDRRADETIRREDEGVRRADEDGHE
jgi:hypothetical protein